MYSYGPPHMAGQKQDDQHEHTFSSYVRIRDVALTTCQRRWTIGKSGERGSDISVLAARHDDDCQLYRLFLSNTNNLHTVGWFQVFLPNTNNLYTIIWFQVTIPFLVTVQWFLVFQLNTNNFQTDQFDQEMASL